MDHGRRVGVLSVPSLAAFSGATHQACWCSDWMKAVELAALWVSVTGAVFGAFAGASAGWWPVCSWARSFDSSDL